LSILINGLPKEAQAKILHWSRPAPPRQRRVSPTCPPGQ